MGFLAFAESVQILPDFALVVHVLIILAMIWILNRTFFRPINRVIAARDTGKGGQMSDAEKMLKSADDKEQKYHEDLLSARNEGYELIEERREKAVSARAETVAAAKAEVAAQRAAGFGKSFRILPTTHDRRFPRKPRKLRMRLVRI